MSTEREKFFPNTCHIRPYNLRGQGLIPGSISEPCVTLCSGFPCFPQPMLWHCSEEIHHIGHVTRYAPVQNIGEGENLIVGNYIEL